MLGKLVIIPTPIGNLGDMPPRALDALQAADAICAEDTRVTGKLLAALGVEGKRLERLDENVIVDRIPEVLARVTQGETIAYCTDAGMPGVSDPGLRLVAAAHKAEAPVEVLPGPTAAATAYVASGTTSPTFYFGGFFPRKDKARRDLLEQLRALDAALIFYESPNRLVSTLEVIADVYPHREIAVARELTKLHEEVTRGNVAAILDDYRQRSAVKGEIVLVIDPPDADESAPSAESVADRAVALANSGERPKTIARTLVAEFGIPRNQAYETALRACKQEERHDLV